MVFRQLELGFTLKGKQDKSVRFINFTFFFFFQSGKSTGKTRGEKNVTASVPQIPKKGGFALD